MFGLARFVLAAAIAFSVTAALGQGRQVDYPNRPIKLIVAFPPGGATDVIARVVGQPLGQRLGQQVIVDNRPGSNGNIAAEVAAKAKPDGYTLMIGPDSLFGINPHLYAKMPVDLAKDFVPITN
jgi:tripartite-type tricarboxylate transporter receptor subunit TctC